MVHLTEEEVHALCAPELPTPRLRSAAAGGGGRGRVRRDPQDARPRLSRRERRQVNDALLRRDISAEDTKSLFDVPVRAPTHFAALRDVRAVRAALKPQAQTVDHEPRANRRIRALVKEKGAFVRPILSSIEERVRGTRAGERLMLHLADSLSRLIAHGVAQFYGHVHRSERVGSERVVVVCASQDVRPLPPVRLVDLLV